MIIAVTGGRAYWSPAHVWHELDIVHRVNPILLLMHGACPTGVDAAAEAWAKDREVPYLGIPAQWSLFGKVAGPYRNAKMTNFGGLVPAKLLAFPGNRGTADMIKKAEAAGIPVVHLSREIPEPQ